jgi:hypothetical protein
MKVLQKKVGEKPEIVDIPNTLEALQETVGGYIETVTEYTAAGAFTVICNEEGRLKGYDYNCEINDVSYVGDICVVGFEGEEFTDLPGETAKIITDYINRGTDRKRGAGMTNGEKHIEKLSDWYKEAVTEGGACYLTCDDKNTLAYALKCCKHFEDIKKDIDSWGLREEISNSEKSNRSEISTVSIIENDCETYTHNKGILECDMYGCKYEPTTKNNLGVDCISRADAIHAVSEALERAFVEHEDIANKLIGKLPAVTLQEPILKKVNMMKSEIADLLEFWDYSPNNNPLARDMLETITNFWGDMSDDEV